MSSVRQQLRKKVLNKHPKKRVDYLTVDDELPNQKWCCLSFIGPKMTQQCPVVGVKVRGCYATKEKAEARCQFLHKKEPQFDIFVTSVGSWVPVCTDASMVPNQVYQEDLLNEMVRGYTANQQERTKVFTEDVKLKTRKMFLLNRHKQNRIRKIKLQDGVISRAILTFNTDNKITDYEKMTEQDEQWLQEAIEEDNVSQANIERKSKEDQENIDKKVSDIAEVMPDDSSSDEDEEVDEVIYSDQETEPTKST